ncbi:MAG: hypothetical protein M1462_04125 [Candidatus Thermoplasmatota archaeon]|nr:hypothetical protein [Candidatus Thermoplasmatota archaeon]
MKIREDLLDIPINELLEENFIEKLLLKGYAGNIVACSIELDECINERFLLFIIGKQLNLKSFKHNIDIIYQYIILLQFRSILKNWSFLATISVNYLYYRVIVLIHLLTYSPS